MATRNQQFHLFKLDNHFLSKSKDSQVKCIRHSLLGPDNIKPLAVISIVELFWCMTFSLFQNVSRLSQSLPSKLVFEKRHTAFIL